MTAPYDSPASPTTATEPVGDTADSWIVRCGQSARKCILEWYSRYRRILPWRDVDDPYLVVVSEIMLQQTGVERVVPKFQEFVRLFPSFESLANAATADVIRAWSGLGYNRRAINLQRLARVVVTEHGGRLPLAVMDLKKLPGVGDYTAAAIACFCHGADVAAIDVNVRRVIRRLAFAGRDVPVSEVDRLARALVPPGRSRDWNQALMDLGSGHCALHRPTCLLCPARNDCSFADAPATPDANYAKTPRRVAEPKESFYGSTRYYRGRIVEYLRQLPPGVGVGLDDLGPSVKSDWIESDGAWLAGIVAGLVRDGLVTRAGDLISLP